MHICNNEDVCFNVGDTVYTTSPRFDEACYPAKVLSIVGPDRKGIRHVLLVRSCVDGYLTIKWGQECFKSEEQYQRLMKEEHV